MGHRKIMNESCIYVYIYMWFSNKILNESCHTNNEITFRWSTRMSRMSNVQWVMSHIQRVMSHVQWVMSHVHWVMSYIQRVMSRIQRVMSHVQWVMSHVHWVMSHIQRVMSRIQRVMSHVQWVMSHIQRVMSHLQWVMSHIQRVMSHVQWVMSHIQQVLFRIQTTTTADKLDKSIIFTADKMIDTAANTHLISHGTNTHIQRVMSTFYWIDRLCVPICIITHIYIYIHTLWSQPFYLRKVSTSTSIVTPCE